MDFTRRLTAIRSVAKTMPDHSKRPLTRREMLSASLFTGGSLLLGVEALTASIRDGDSRRGFLQGAGGEFAGGKQIGTVGFTGESNTIMDAPFNSELDGREYTDFSKLTPDNLVTPTDKFYIRTRASKLLDLGKPWTIRLGQVSGATSISAGRLAASEVLREAEPMGLHFMECSGNQIPAHFGMLSVADWAGVPITKLAERLRINKSTSYVLVSGFDTYTASSTTSIAGASWIFPWDDLVSTGAFLATKMNGQELTRDHGAPVRLFVPGWYGCCCIKWVDEITPVDTSAEATSQMQEYASRTHQQGVPKLAREYDAAQVDPAAMPIRVEKWLVNGKIEYRVMGILWGGRHPVNRLEIQYHYDGNWSLVEKIYQTNADTWKIWTQHWSPEKPGTYVIRLRVKDPQERTLRLDTAFYRRTVEITEV
jgi:DMSO/TMAO reductase YedYZ molybdopterin-dependent catalytic subunit